MMIKRVILATLQNFALVSYHGNFSTWAQADKMCIGYNSEDIFSKVKDATLKVKKGEACYERDGCLFYEEKYNYPLISYLEKLAMESGELLNIIDWGGALGSTYFQNRKLLQNKQFKIKWRVVEQDHFVEYGKKALQDEELQFEKIEEVCIDSACGVLLSGVLQYIESYVDVLERILNGMPQYVIIERTPLGNRNRIVIEKVREPIYRASYPCRLLCEEEVIQYICSKGYYLIDQWHSEVDRNIPFWSEEYTFKSLVFKRIVIID